MNTKQKFRILALDGGGARGVFALGALEELQALLKTPIHESFDLIYGTSTGAIIASLLSIGRSPAEISALYLDWIPTVFSRASAKSRSLALRECGRAVLEGRTFSDCLVPLGVTTTDCTNERPRIFKSSVEQSFSRKESFQPGFGATILDAVMASCAAVPYFERVEVETTNQGRPLLMDGGFVANNPTLFAVTDAIGAFGVAEEDISVLSIGVGRYVEPRPNIFEIVVRKCAPIEVFEKMLLANSNSTDWLVSNVFKQLKKIRIDKDHPDKRFEFSILSSDRTVLEKARTLGRDAFGERENEIVALLCGTGLEDQAR